MGKLAVDKAVGLLERLVEGMEGTMPLRTALVFLKIAQRHVRDEECDVSAVAEAMGIPLALASRDVGILSQFSRAAEGGGMEVVELFPDMKDRRRKRVRLTKKGAKVLDAATDAIR